jgi:hypothetical protein
MISTMTSKLSVIAVSATVLATACASTGTTSESRSEASPASAASAEIPRRACTAANTRVAGSDGLIADFSTKQGQVQASVPRAYPATTTQSATTKDGRLVIDVNAVPTASPQYLATDLLLDGCLDASAFSGVQFTIAGSLSGCSLQYGSVDPGHQFVGPDGPYPPEMRVSTAGLGDQPRTITAPFAKPDIAGRPATPVDASRLAFVQWLVIVPVGSADGTPVPPCTGQLVIDDVKLYR